MHRNEGIEFLFHIVALEVSIVKHNIVINSNKLVNKKLFLKCARSQTKSMHEMRLYFKP